MGYDFFWHGVFMWSTWTGFGLVQVASNRYFKADLLGTHMWIHRIIGTLMMVITLYHGVRAWIQMSTIVKNTHSIFVFPILFLILFIALGGVLTRSKLRRNVWKTAQALMVKRIHRFFAYAIILSSIGAIYSGLKGYRTNPKHPDDTEWEIYHLILVAFLFLAPEFAYRRSMSVEIAYDVDGAKLKCFTMQEFKETVEAG